MEYKETEVPEHLKPEVVVCVVHIKECSDDIKSLKRRQEVNLVANAVAFTVVARGSSTEDLPLASPPLLSCAG